jgi:PhnB protein
MHPPEDSTMQLNPYLFFDGQCEAAIKFYAQTLNGKIEMMMRASDAPASAQSGDDWGDKIMHARLVVGDQVLMASDAPHDRYSTPQGFRISVSFDDPTQAERVFNAFANQGTVQMPLEQTFWAYRFGMVVDRFGTPWMVNCEKAE